MLSTKKLIGYMHNSNDISKQVRQQDVYPANADRRLIVQKNILTPPIWRPLKISPSKVDKPTSGTELYHHANFHANWPQIHILYLFSHCVSFALLIIDFIVILHVRLIRVLLKINQSYLSQCKKIHIVPYRDGGYRPRSLYFRKLSSSRC